MEFSIQTAGGRPIYQQLADQICAAIARGRLRPDQRLPSVRELSQTLVVNPNTIARAYTELEREGVLYTRPGLGVFVAPSPPPLSKKTRRERILESIDRLLVEAVRLGFDPAELMELIDERARRYHWTASPTESS